MTEKKNQNQKDKKTNTTAVRNSIGSKKTGKTVKAESVGLPSENSIPGIVPVAVVGVGCLFPGSSNINGFWRDILEGTNHVKEVPPTHFLIDDFYDPDFFKPDKTYAKTGAFLSPIEFDPMEYGIPPANIPCTDTSQLLSMVVAKQVLEDAFNGKYKDVDKSRVSVILGVAAGLELLGEMAGRLGRPVWLKALREEGVPEDEAQRICDRIVSHSTPWKESTFPGLLGNVVAGRIANRFNLGGTNCTNDAACASSFSALSQSLNELYLGQADVAITGGADTNNDPFLFISFSKTPALSRTGDCRPFSDEADGMILGEGIGMCALKRLQDAERDGDKIYAVIKGIGSSSDGSGTSVYAPLAEGQAKALRRCYQSAGYGPDTVELVEAHGTGTYVGDEVEVNALKTVFTESGRKDNQWCALGSIKSQIGHTKSTAAVASLIKAVMAVQHKILPPTIKVKKPDPKLGLEQSPLYLNTRSRPWIKSHDYPRRVSVSSFGFGGTNFHVTLEEYTGSGKKAPRQRVVPEELILYSSDSHSKLLQNIKESDRDIQKEGVLRFVSFKSMQEFKSEDPYKLAIIASDGVDLQTKIKKAVDFISRKPEDSFSLPNGLYYSAGIIKADPIVFVFPGQGSQYIDMGFGLYLYFSEVQSLWDEVNLILKDQGLDLSGIVYPKPVFTKEDSEFQMRTLTQTQWAQPSICAVSAGISHILKKLGIKPAFTAGHSLGELTALYEAGVLDLQGLVKTSRKRGELMAESGEVPGAMTAVAEPPEKISKLLNEWKSKAVISNYNTPKQIVLSGTVDDIEDAEKRLIGEKIKSYRLNVSTAFHSPMMDKVCAPFERFLKDVKFNKASIPVFSNAEAAAYPAEQGKMKKILTKQLNHSVRFVQSIEKMYESGARIFIEAGPGNITTGFIKKILAGRPHKAVNIDNKSKHGISSLWHALGELSVSGCRIDFMKLWEAFDHPKDPREKPKPKFSVMLQGCNYDRQYPPKDGKLPPPNPPRTEKKETDQPNRATLPNTSAQRVEPANPAIGNPAQTRTESSRTTGNTDTHTSKTAASNINHKQKRSERPFMKGNMNSWLSAFQEIQRQNAEAHAVFQKAISESHIAFLRAAEAQNMALGSMMTGQPVAQPEITHSRARIDIPDALTGQAPPPAAPAPQPQFTQSVQSTHMDYGEVSRPVHHAPQTAPVMPDAAHTAAVHTPPQPPAPSTQPVLPADIDFKEMLLDVVFEKTGYPKEILTVDMGLEADLGIDSIKRVEILSAIKDQNPWLPEVDPGEMANITTLGDVLGFIEKFSSELKSTPAISASHPQPQEIESTISAPASSDQILTGGGDLPADIDFKEMLLDVVSDKTGYPKEILTVEMGLEADLGIDSIKRVEILSAIKDQNPWLPEVDPGEMANIVTLGDVLTFIEKFKNDVKKKASVTETSGDKASGLIQTPDVDRTGKPSWPVGMGRFVLKAVPAPRTGFSMEGFVSGAHAAVTSDGGGIAEELVKLLKSRGINAVISDDVAENTDICIFLGGLKKIQDEYSATVINKEAFLTARKIAKHMSQSGGIFITVQDTGGDFGLSGNAGIRAWSAGLPGLVKSAAIEWQSVSVKAVDIERGQRTPKKIAQALIEEFFTGGPEIEVGLGADGSRIRLESRPAEITALSSRINSSSVIIASGGARGVTSETLIELARTYQPKIALLGRTLLEDDPQCCAGAHTDSEIKKALLEEAKASGSQIKPSELGSAAARILANREIKSTLKSLGEAGSRAIYIASDVQDPAELSKALDLIKNELGPITGIVHGAGVLNDKFIVDKTSEQFERVFNTKVEGLRALLKATENDPLDLICLFSSVAARYGNMGQCDYSMANEILNKTAREEKKKRGAECVVKSINWGPWDGGMVSPLLKSHFKQMGIPLIPIDFGARRFVEEVSESDTDYTEVLIGPSPPRPSLLNKIMSPSLELNLDVNKTRYPFIDSHKIKDIPVVPAVLVLEWFSRAAELCCSNLRMNSCSEFKVLRGIKLESFQNGEKIKIRCDQNIASGKTVLNMELINSGEHPHYKAVIEMSGSASSNRSEGNKLKDDNMKPWEFKLSDIYKKHLFHGPDFQVIDSLDKVSEKGAVALLKNLRMMNWPGEYWATDAALLDGGLQLAILWGLQLTGKKSLPTKIGKYINYKQETTEGLVRCELAGNVDGASRTLSDIAFYDTGGTLLCELRGVEMHML